MWTSVLSWGVALGAKLFDLLVLAPAWGGHPPESFSLLPYGARFPIDPGNFFQPLSALILVATLGALISGWKTTQAYRKWLWIPLLAFALIWICTPTLFWPMINELWAIARGRLVRTEAECISLVRRWMILDALRATAILVAFLCAVRAISLPYRENARP